MEIKRCTWCAGNELMQIYHDTEWGVPVHDDKKHFEFMVLDAFQAGLSWLTILKRRENFRKAFADFDVKKVSRFDEKKVQKLLQNEGIIRNNLKIRGTIANAHSFIKIQEEFGSFDAYIWKFVNGKPFINKRKSSEKIPASSPGSDAMSRDLKLRNFSFAGTTICYAYMQAAGLINDHQKECFRFKVC